MTTIEPIHDPSIEGEEANMRRLWCAVIIAAITDARAQIRDGATLVHKRQAVEWLTTPNADFNEVCSLAGLDPEATRERLCTILASEIEELELQHRETVRQQEEQQRQQQEQQRQLSLERKRRMIEGRTPTIYLTHGGVTLTVRQWAARIGVSPVTIYRRFNDNWPAERILTTPSRKCVRRRAEGPSARQAAGVAEDFGDLTGTGAPQGAQDLTEIEFSE